MRKHKNLKKLYIETIAFVLLFALLGAVLMFEQNGYRAHPNTEDSSLLDEDAWYNVRNKNAGAVAKNAPKCLVLRNSRSKDSKSLAKNIAFTLKSMNVNVTVKDIFKINFKKTPDNLKTANAVQGNIRPMMPNTSDVKVKDFKGYDEVVFCFSNLSYFGQDINELKAWVQNGGHLLLAGGLDEKTDLNQWAELLGISPEKAAVPAPVKSLKFNTDLLAGAKGREFSEDVFSGTVLNLAVTEDCTVHIASAEDDKIPLLWERSVDSGSVVVCNADLMENKDDRGVIASVYCRFYPVYVYPVINACVYCIDDCPSPIPAGYEKNVIEQYGYTVGDFYANVWMPRMQSIAEEYGIKYSTFAVQTYDDKTDGDFNNTDNRDTASYYASLILNMGGEVGIHGYNHQPLVLEGYKFDKENAGYKPWPNVISMLNSVKAAIRYTESLTDDLYAESYVAPSNVLSKEALTEMQSQIENLRVYAGVYIGTSDQLVQEFKTLKSGIVYCPRLTADMQMEDSEWWTQINELNYHYVESNFIHPDDILDEQRSDGGDFSQMVEGYTKMIKWNRKMGLRNTTISDCGGAVQRYSNLNYTQTASDDGVKLHIDGLIDEAYMMIRTNGKRIASVKGGSVRALSDDIAVLKVTNPDVTVKTVDIK